MSVKPILIYPDENKILTQESATINDINDIITRHLSDLDETLYSSPGVGLAAPQIGELIKAVIIDVSRANNDKKKYQTHGKLVMINPVIKKLENPKLIREGCLSVPQYTANVNRYDYVEVEYMTPDGEIKTLETSGFEAIAIQHELDHLTGTLFIHRVSLATDLIPRKQK